MTELLKKEKIYSLPLTLYLPLTAAVLTAMYAGALPDNSSCTLLLLMVTGGLMKWTGDRLPVVRTWLGGGTIVCLFGASFMAHFHLFPAETLSSVDFLLNEAGFLNFFIVSMIIGSILGMDRELLIKSAPRVLPLALASMAFGALIVVLAGAVLGFTPRDSLLFTAIPMMSGGIGAGVIPLSGMYAQAMGSETSAMMSRLIPVSAIGNIFAILTAAVLSRIGEIRPALSGNGILLRGYVPSAEKKEGQKVPPAVYGTGLLLSLLFYMAGTCLNHFLPAIHSYAWMIIAAAVCRASGLISDSYADAAGAWSRLVIRIWTSAILVGVGATLIDLNATAAALTPASLVMIFTLTVSVSLGAAVGGWLIGFYPVEAAITSGLSTINMGGSGNIAILSASRRMQLLGFAQFTTRLCGGLVLVLASFLLKILY